MNKLFKNQLIVRVRKMIDLWAYVFVWALLIFSFSSIPTKPVSEIHWKDFLVKKLTHIFMYAVFSVLLYRSLKESGFERKKALHFAIIISVFYGFSDEFHQSFTPGRDPKIRDVFFDTIGTLAGALFIWKLLPKAQGKLRSLAKDLRIL